MTLSDFSRDEIVEYRMGDRWLRAIIVRVTDKRLVLRLDDYPRNLRNTTPDHVRKI